MPNAKQPGHVLHIYDIEKGFGDDFMMRPAISLRFTGADAVIHAHDALLDGVRDIHLATVSPDPELCETIEEFARLTNATANWLERNLIPNCWVGKLVDDPAHWAEFGVTTPVELAELLAAEDERNLDKGRMDFDPS